MGKSGDKKLSKSKQIDYRFKILYALGIIFVVVGHGTGGINLDGGGWFPLYSFHLALFMFCSGYFYKIDSHKNMLGYIWKKIKRLIIPLFLWNLFYAGFVLLISNFGFKLGTPVTIEKLTTAVITSGHQFQFNMGGWFVVPLFMCMVSTVIIRKCLDKYNGKLKEWLLAALYLALGVLGIWLAHRGWGSGVGAGWPLVVTRMLALMPFFGLGILYKTKLEKYDHLKNWVYFAAVFSVQLFVICKNKGGIPSGTPSWSIYYDTLSTLLIAITGIAFYLRIAKILEPAIGRSKIINKIADNTFAIMIHQFLGFWLVTLGFGLALAALGRGGFDWNEFHTSIWYKYYPMGQWRFGLIYIAAGLGVPILMQAGVDKLKAQCVVLAESFSKARQSRRKAHK